MRCSARGMDVWQRTSVCLAQRLCKLVHDSVAAIDHKLSVSCDRSLGTNEHLVPPQSDACFVCRSLLTARGLPPTPSPPRRRHHRDPPPPACAAPPRAPPVTPTSRWLPRTARLQQAEQENVSVWAGGGGGSSGGGARGSLYDAVNRPHQPLHLGMEDIKRCRQPQEGPRLRSR